MMNDISWLPYIKSIQIRYFRSLYNVRIDFSNMFSILTGSNNAGKSNVLKALNLFFNEETEWQTKINFSRDFSIRRDDELRKRKSKAKPSIVISVKFSRGELFKDTLPSIFTVSKTWYDNATKGDINVHGPGRENDQQHNPPTDFMLQIVNIFLSRHRYIYIPAIKDIDVFTEIMSYLHHSIFEQQEKFAQRFNDELAVVNNYLKSTTGSLRKDFLKATDVPIDFSLPSNLPDAFRSVPVRIVNAEQLGASMDINALGDGIRLRMIPTILDYMAKRSKQRHIWGFEEPENSMEYRRANQMFQSCATEYRKNSQIVITTHSPAFISVDDNRCSLFRAIKVGDDTTITPVDRARASGIDDLTIAEELGHISLMSQLHQIMEGKIAEAEEAKARTAQLEIQAKQLESEIEKFSKPVIVTEGKTDVMIIKEAWKKVFPGEIMPCEVISCDTTPDSNSTGGSGGAPTLAKHFCSIIPGVTMPKIGIFDNDREGQLGFRLDRNYSEFLGKSWVKAHSNGRAFAILLPPIAEKQDLIEAQNFPIEFMFDEEFLSKEVEGHKLVLLPMSVTVQCNNVPVTSYLADQLRFMKIDGNSKIKFAKYVVPYLPQEAFRHFKILFDQIIEIMSLAKPETKNGAQVSILGKKNVEEVGKAVENEDMSLESRSSASSVSKHENDEKATGANRQELDDTAPEVILESQNAPGQSVYLLNCKPHNIVNAYSFALSTITSIPQMQKKFGEKNISVLLRLGLIDHSGQPQIPLWSDSSDPNFIVGEVASRHEALEFARPLVKQNPNISPKDLGEALANNFNIKNWKMESKHKIGVSLRDWALWMERKEADASQPMTSDEIIADILENGNVRAPIWLLFSDDSHRSHGRRRILNELGLLVVEKLLTDHKLSKSKVAKLFGIAASTLNNYFPGFYGK